MYETFTSWSGCLVLVIALSADLFVTCMAYGGCRIRISWPARFIFSGMGSLCLGISMSLGNVLTSWLPAEIPRVLGCICLCVLGVGKLVDSLLKRRKRSPRELRSLSLLEASFLAFAMSLDSLLAGLGVGFWETGRLPMLVTSFLIGLLSASLGAGIGRMLAEKSQRDFTWLSSLLLIGLAVKKLIP